MVVKGDKPGFTGDVLWTRAIFVVIANALERLAYFTMQGNITTFFSRELKMEAVFSQQMQAVSSAVVCLLPVIGSIIADMWLGRFLTAAIGEGLSLIGAGLMIWGSAGKIDVLFLVAFFVLYTAPVAVVKPNLIVLGADQFNENDIDQLKQRDLFFSANYWAQNIGAAVAFLLISQIAIEGMGAITTDFSFTFSFILGTCTLCLSFIVLMVGSKRLWAAEPQGSVLIDFGKITADAFKDGANTRGIVVFSSLAVLFATVLISIITYFFDNVYLSCTVGAIIIICCAIMIFWGGNSDWVMNAWRQDPKDRRYTFDEIKAVASVYRLSPYMAFCIPFWAIYNQQYTSYVSLACQMNNDIGGTFIAPAGLSAYNACWILCFVPILEYGIAPALKKWKGGKFALTPLRRIGMGLFAAAGSVTIACVLEYIRRSSDILMTTCTDELINKGHCSTLGASTPVLSSCYSYTGPEASEPVPKHDINIYWLVFAEAMLGTSEVLVCITYWDFFYSQVPANIRSVCQAANFLTQSLGTLVGAVINSVCKVWLPNNLDHGNQEYMYFINIAFMLLTAVTFIIVSRSFEYLPGTSGMPGDMVQPLLIHDQRHSEDDTFYEVSSGTDSETESELQSLAKHEQDSKSGVNLKA